jgi:hypothetical protein
VEQSTAQRIEEPSAVSKAINHDASQANKHINHDASKSNKQLQNLPLASIAAAPSPPPTPSHVVEMTAFGYDAAGQASWSTFGKSFNLSALLEGQTTHGLSGVCAVPISCVLQICEVLLHGVQSFDHSRPLSSLSSLFQLFNLFACYHCHHSHRSSGTASTASGATHSLLTTQGLQVGRCATTTTQPSVRLAFACAVELLAMRPSGERERLPC